MGVVRYLGQRRRGRGVMGWYYYTKKMCGSISIQSILRNEPNISIIVFESVFEGTVIIPKLITYLQEVHVLTR